MSQLKQPAGPKGTDNDLSRSKKGRNRVIAAACAILTMGAAWFSTLTGPPAAPVDAPPTSSAERSYSDWHYPKNDVMYSIVADDFSLSLNGTFEIHSENLPGGLTKEYLENCMKLTPYAPFTVEALGNGAFRVLVLNGQNLPRTLVELPSDPTAEYKAEPFRAWIEPHLAARLTTEPGNDGVPIDRPIQIDFSYPMDFGESPESYVTLSPFQPCSVEVSDNSLVIIPDEMLDYGQTYVVTVSRSMVTTDGQSFSVDQTMPFTTELQNFSLIMTNQGASTVSPDESVVMEYQLDTAGRGARSGEVTLFAIDGNSSAAFDAYVAFLETMPLPQVVYQGKQDWRNPVYQMGDGATPPEAMTEIDSWSGDFPEGLSTVTFDNPGQGFYIIRTTVIDPKTKEPYTWYKPFQVATPSIYMQSAKGQSFFWLNDSVTGELLSGHTIRFLRGDFQSELASAVTGSDGAALLNVPKPRWEEDPSRSSTVPGESIYTFSGFPGEFASLTPEEAARRNQLCTIFVVYDRQGRPVYADTTASLTDEYLPANKYFSFFYLDRTLYRPTDEIHFWGYVKPYRYNPAPLPDALTVRFDPNGLNQAVPVTLAPDGTYSGVIKLDKVVSAEYDVTVEYTASELENRQRAQYYGEPYGEGSRTLDSEWIEVNEFQKPAYTIEATVDKPIYRWGDEVAVTIVPSFFDGTPAPYMPLECSLFNPSTGNIDAIVNLETDAAGKAVYKFKAGDCLSFHYDQNWTPKRAYFYIKISSEGENITSQGHYNYIPGDVAIRPTMEIDDADNARLTVLANKITLDAIQTEEDLAGIVNEYYYADFPDSRYDILLGEPLDIDLTATVRIDYCRLWDGSYDKRYYDYTEDKRTFTIQVKDGKAAIENLAEMNRRPNTYLYVHADVSYPAPGCTVHAAAYASNRWPRYDSTEEAIPKGYSFNVYRNDSDQPQQQRQSYMLQDLLEAENGDSLRFALCKDGQELPNAPGRLMYTLLQDGVVEHAVTAPSFQLTQNPAYANNVVLVAAYFDGKDVYPVTNCQVSFARESVRLNVETTADQETYLPGQKVTLTAKVTDPTGAPVSANVCFSVVDEAVFALREHNFELLTELYGQMNFYNYFVSKYTTRTGDIDPYNAGGDGGKGEGDNLLAYDIFRKNFKDTALFYPVKSNASGVATVTFTLPDNLTSWRVTTLTVNGLPAGGQSRSQIIASMPFFVKPVISSKYIAGDEVSMLIQGHGSALAEDHMVDYTVTLRGDNIEDIKTVSEKAFESAMISFGKLPEGDYTITATGSVGQYRDTVELPLSVIHSNLELTVHQAFDPRQPVSLPNSRYPVTITLYDTDYQTYYKCLNSLMRHYCSRLDQRMSRYISRKALLRTCGPEDLPSHLQADDDLSGYQRDDGGIGWWLTDSGWPGDGSRPILTVEAFLAAPEQFSQDRLRRYLLAVSADSASEPEEQAAAVAGLCAIDPTYGQTAGERIYASGATLTEKLWYGIGLAYAGDRNQAQAFYAETVEPKLKRGGGLLRITDVGNAHENDGASALAWVLATKLGLEDANGYANYFSQNPWMISSLFQCMIFVRNYPLDPTPYRFTYSAGGKTGEVDLSITGSKTFTFGKDDLEGLVFHDVPEGVSATAYYIGEPEEIDMIPSEHLSLTKETIPMENGKYKNILRVELDSEAASGYYSIDDWIPSNCRLHSIQDKEHWFHYMQEGQKLYFEFYQRPNDGKIRTFTYYTQRCYDTEAVQDRAYLICADTGENAHTERSMFQ